MSAATRSPPGRFCPSVSVLGVPEGITLSSPKPPFSMLCGQNMSLCSDSNSTTSHLLDGCPGARHCSDGTAGAALDTMDAPLEVTPDRYRCLLWHFALEGFGFLFSLLCISSHGAPALGAPRGLISSVSIAETHNSWCQWKYGLKLLTLGNVSLHLLVPQFPHR